MLKQLKNKASDETLDDISADDEFSDLGVLDDSNSMYMVCPYHLHKMSPSSGFLFSDFWVICLCNCWRFAHPAEHPVMDFVRLALRALTTQNAVTNQSLICKDLETCNRWVDMSYCCASLVNNFS